MAVFTGGTFAQVSMYIYSIATLAIFLWGLKSMAEEKADSTLTFAHLFALDHFISTTWTVIFASIWWYHTPHDGRRIANSDAQKEMMTGPIGGGGVEFADTAERVAAAERVWLGERGFAAVVLIFGWLVKIYFAICIYSFAVHLRRGTYHSLPFSKPSPTPSVTANSRNYRYVHVRTTSVATSASMVSEGAIWESPADVESEVILGSVDPRASAEDIKRG